MSRFFIGREAFGEDSVIISGEDVNHIRKVLRLQPGEVITVCDGEGKEYSARIELLEANYVKAGIVGMRECDTEPPVEITLFQGVPKSDKMDYVIQKSIELGVNAIVPVLTDRTVVKISTKKDCDAKTARWQRISLEAAKQCNRGIIPVVSEPVPFKKALESSKNYGQAFIPYEKEKSSRLKDIVKFDSGTKRIAVFIGPEGGFTEEEVAMAKECNIKPVTLGPRILRTETAGIAVLSILMYELGDIG